MGRLSRLLAIPLLALPASLAGQSEAAIRADLIRSALSAGPSSVTRSAAVADMQGNTLRPGTNGWVCMPDDPAVPNNSPMCIDEAWRNMIAALMSRGTPSFTGVGVGYMLQGDMPVSNNDPFATGPTPDNQWLQDGVPHIMVLVPGAGALDGMSTDPANGGPWVMWKGTPYAHIMIPTPPASR